MPVIDLETLRHAAVFREPFPFLIAPHAVLPTAQETLRRDFPPISQPGLFPLRELEYGPTFATLVDDLLSPEVEAALGEALDVKLSEYECLVTVRGRCRERDGRIHSDSADKVATAILYLNDDEWIHDGGRLRFLRDPLDMNSVIAEVPPAAGTLVAFRRSENSWHGHLPYNGVRRSIMVNWMADADAVAREAARHTLSARAKALTSWWQ